MLTDINIKSIRKIIALCALPAFLVVGSATVAQSTRALTTEELIAEVEAEAKQKASSPESLENQPKSAAEILAEIEALSIPTNASATEEVDKGSDADAGNDQGADNEEETTGATGSGTEELPLDSGPLPDEVIGEYAVDQDDETEVAIEVVEEDAGEISSATVAAPEETASETLYEKADALEPLLMLAGTPADDEADAQLSEKVSGKIIAEKKPVARRRHVYRWVLKTEDGRRIPLKSNIKLLQEVRRENVLDSEVSLTGYYVTSGFNDKLRYFVVESVVILEDEPSDEPGDSKTVASGKNRTAAASGTSSTAPAKQK